MPLNCVCEVDFCRMEPEFGYKAAKTVENHRINENLRQILEQE